MQDVFRRQILRKTQMPPALNIPETYDIHDLAEVFEDRATPPPPEQQAGSPGVPCWTVPLVLQLLLSRLSAFRKIFRSVMATLHSKILVHYDYLSPQSPVPSEIWNWHQLVYFDTDGQASKASGITTSCSRHGAGSRNPDLLPWTSCRFSIWPQAHQITLPGSVNSSIK